MRFKITFILTSVIGLSNAPAAISELPSLNQQAMKKVMASSECKEFVELLEGGRDQENGLKTEQLIVIKDGVIQYESYDGVRNSRSPHCLWSASKTVTMTLLGTAVQEGKVRLEQKLSEFFPKNLRNDEGAMKREYENITLADLVSMGAGFQWREAYDDDIKESTVLKMLYLDGKHNMTRFALNAPMEVSPGTKYTYSGGNSNLIQGVLRKVYGRSYQDMPWKNLFDAIGMSNVIFEQDQAGTFVGSSYVHMSARDMARLGLLYLNDGMFKGRRILPEGWMKMVKSVSPAILAPGTSKEYIQREGVFGGTMWLNTPVKGLPKPFPNAPEDMFFAAGHYGQLIIALPSEKLLIVRTGYDQEYWSRIDKMVKKGLRCFAPKGGRS